MRYLRKFTRIFLRSLGVILLFLIVLGISLIIAIQSHAFQTWAGKQASGYLSKEWNTTVSIDKVEIDFFNSAQLKRILVKDLKSDTLFYGGSISCKIEDFSYKRKSLKVKVTELDSITVKLHQYKGDTTLNFQFIADYFASSDTSATDTSSGGFIIDYGKLALKNVNFVFRDFNDTSKTKGMNFSDLDFRNINGEFDQFKMNGDSVDVFIHGLSLYEKCGLTLRKLTTKAHVSSTGVKLDTLHLETNKTLLQGRFYMLTNSYHSYDHFEQNVYLLADLKDSTVINGADIAWFVPDLIGLDDKVKLSGKIKGTISSLHGEHVKIAFGKNTRFSGNFGIEGLPIPEDTYLHFDIKELATNSKDLSRIPVPPFDKKARLEVPKEIMHLGNIQYKGQIDGLLTDIASFGVLNTSIGSISMDIGLSMLDDKNKQLAYHGKVKTNHFNLGVFLDNKDIGSVSMDAKLSGEGVNLDYLEATLEGKVMEMNYNNYTYKNISITGGFKKKLFNGKFLCEDENANLDFYGSASFVNKIPELDFIATVNKLDLAKTHFIKNDTSAFLSSQIAIQLSGDNLDHLSGRVNFDDNHYTVKGKEHKLNTFDFILEQNKYPKTVKLNSGIADLKASGNFELSNLSGAFTAMLESYYPAFFKKKEGKEDKRYYDNFEFSLKFKKFNIIKELFIPDLMISPGTLLEGKFDASKNFFELKGKSDKIDYTDFVVKNWTLNANTRQNDIVLGMNADKLFLSDSMHLAAFEVDLISLDNKSEFIISWNNAGKKRNEGKIEGLSRFDEFGTSTAFSKIDLFVEDSLWQLEKEGMVLTDSSGTISFDQIVFKNHGQLIKVEGLISKNPKDQLMVTIENFILTQLNPLLKSSDLQLSGTLSGTSNISDLMNHVIFSSAMDFTKLTVNNKPIGTGEINSFYDKQKDVMSLNGHFLKDYASGSITDPNFKNIKFLGYYYPNKKEENLEIDFELQSLDISIIQPYVAGIMTFSKGFISGKGRVSGSANKPQINAKLSLESVRNLRVDYLNTYYTMSGDIIIEPDRIAMEGIYLFDANGNSAVVWGNIFHDNFKNIKLDFDINATKFMVLNTNASSEEAFYGKAYVSGNVGIYGSPDLINMDIHLKTEKGTSFNIPLSGPAEVGDNEFIQFVIADTSFKDEEKNDLSGMRLNFVLEATPDAEIQLIFDEKAGDVIKATGKGNINMNINTNGNFEMFGSYVINDGSYMFSLENFISRKFDIENGSTIKWSGDPYNAAINITANYKQRASLAPFFPTLNAPTDESGTSSASTAASNSSATQGVDVNKRYPVEAKLLMRDKLLTPEITFGIGLPTVDDAIRQQVMGFINNEQELNRQVFSLLILKSFVTPLSLAHTSGVTAGNAVGSNASEMLSNQLSNWLSQLATNIDVGVNYRPGDALSNEELDLALSTQLFNDKLTIDGNVGLNNNSQTNSSNMIGDINIDYKLSDAGKTRVKAFNRSNDTYQISTQGGQFTQGVGVFFREEFDTMTELWNRYMNKVKRKKKKPNSDKKEPDQMDFSFNK